MTLLTKPSAKTETTVQTKQMKTVGINIALAVKVKRNSLGTQASRIDGAQKEDGRNEKQQNNHLGRAE